MNNRDDAALESLAQCISALRPFEARTARYATIQGTRYLQFCETDFFGYRTNRVLRREYVRYLEQFGETPVPRKAGLPRHQILRELEFQFAEMLGTEDALLAHSAGDVYRAIQARVQGGDLSLSFLDSTSPFAQREFSRCGAGGLDSVTDGAWVFAESIDAARGGSAPFEQLEQLMNTRRCTILLDESVAFGLFGVIGGGLREEHGLYGPNVASIVSFEHVLGAQGAVIAGSVSFCDALRCDRPGDVLQYRCSVPTAARVSAGLVQIQKDVRKREQLRILSRTLRRGLQDAGLLSAGAVDAPIVALELADGEQARAFLRGLAERSIVASPTVSADGLSIENRIRFSVSCKHTQSDIATLLDAVSTVYRRL